MAFKSIIFVGFTIIYAHSVLYSVHSAAIQPDVVRTKAGNWFFINELNGQSDIDKQHGLLSRYDFESIVNGYYKKRNDLLTVEINSSFGHDITLNENELRANKIIMAAKEIELKDGIQHPLHFNPSRHLFEVLDKIKHSKLFKLIQKMPKGGVLHIHEVRIEISRATFSDYGQLFLVNFFIGIWWIHSRRRWYQPIFSYR